MVATLIKAGSKKSEGSIPLLYLKQVDEILRLQFMQAKDMFCFGGFRYLQAVETAHVHCGMLKAVS